MFSWATSANASETNFAQMDDSYIAALTEFANDLDSQVKTDSKELNTDSKELKAADIAALVNVGWEELRVQTTEVVEEAVEEGIEESEDTFVAEFLNSLSAKAKLFQHVVEEHDTLDYQEKSFIEDVVYHLSQLNKEDPRGTCESLVKILELHIHACH